MRRLTMSVCRSAFVSGSLSDEVDGSAAGAKALAFGSIGEVLACWRVCA